MKRITNKIFALLLLLALLGVQFIPTGVYASNILEQDNSTSEENVKFNATIGDDSNNQYSYTANIDSDANKFYLSLSVANTGYLKDIAITLENSNYIFAINETEDQRIKSISNNTLELNQINAGENVNLSIPITLDKQDSILADTFNKESKVLLNAVYVNGKNKEKEIKKELTHNLTWTVDESTLEFETSQQVIRYLTYNNQTMLSFILDNKLKDAKLPIANKQIQISVPELSGNKPSNIIINAIRTANTNGITDGSNFSDQNWSYDANTGIVTINVNNDQNAEGRIAWNKNDLDRFVITYLYDVNMNEQATAVNSKVFTNATLMNGVTVSKETEANDYTIDGRIGDIVTAEITSNPGTLNKGYMYNNINKTEGKDETTFSQDYKINMGLAEALDKVTVRESGELLGEADASNYIYNKKVSISQAELIKILGEQGSINVIKEDGTVVGTLNKDTLELEVNAPKITFEISKPVTEGDLTIHVGKAISGDLPFSRDEVKSFTTLTSKILINQEYSTQIALEEPTSKASIEISNDNLSTVVKNEDVVVTATLETDDISDALYENPEITIELPEEVRNMELKDATLLYEDQLVQNQFTVDGNKIYLSLNGTQTKYATQSVSNGTVVRLVMDLTLDNLAPSKEDNITLSYVNNNQAIEARSNTVTAPIDVVAPTGFVTTNTLSGYNGNDTVTSQEGSERTGNLQILSDAKQMNISGVVVNNLGNDATGVKVLGRIPFTGNKEIGSNEDLGTTFDTTMASPVSVDGIDATVYYSDNGEADNNLDNPANGWGTEYTANTKSYMIVANNAVTNTTRFTFNYNVNIPANLQYGSTAKANYGIYYDNNSEEGISQNLVLATRVGVTTGNAPTVQGTISAVDLNSGEAIADGGNVTEGQYLKYTFKVKNTGDQTVNNINAKITLPDGYGRLTIQPFVSTIETEFSYDYIVDDENKEFTETIDTLAPGEERDITMNFAVLSRIETSGEGYENTIRFSVTADEIDNSSESIHTTRLAPGYLSLIMGSMYENNVIEQDDNVGFGINVTNVNNEPKNNVQVKVRIPEKLTYQSSSVEDSNIQGSYNEGTRELTFNLGTIEANSSRILNFSTIVGAGNEDNIQVYATATCDGAPNEMRSNTVNFYNNGYNVTASLSSNITEDTLLDTDDLEYYIDITNNGQFQVDVNFSDIIPEGLLARTYNISVINGTGSISDTSTSNEVINSMTLNAGGSARITIKTEPVIIDEGDQVEITNSPSVTVEGETIQINSLTHTIIGTGGEDNPSGETRYRISGTAWVDENEDGRKDENETRLSGLRVTVIDQNTGNYVQNSNGSIIETTTNDDGRYTLNNLPSGNYLVVVEYDTANYVLTTYRADGISDTENSDFVDARLYEDKVAATNTITISNANIYNIDIGLRESQQFDLSINKVVARATVSNPRLETQVTEYNAKTALVNLLNTYIESSTVLVEYTITVTNEGAIPGYAKEIVDYLPDGMTFVSDLNPNWYLGSDGNLYTTSLANTIIQPGGTATLSLVLSRQMTGENVGTVRNGVEISEAYNEYGLDDVDSTPGNNKDGEDDKSYADVILAMGTGREVASFIGITLGVLAIVAVAVILIKKYIIKNI